MGEELRVRLVGKDAEPGRVLAIDVARLLTGAERAFATAAAYQLGRRPGLTGRKGGAVEASTRLRFRSVGGGSILATLELPDAESEGGLELEDRRLSELAVETTLDVIDGTLTDAGDVPVALNALAEELAIGNRFDAIVFEFRKTHTRQATLDKSTRERLSSLVERERGEGERPVVGTLYEADFEKRSAQLRTPDGRQVKVSFADELADGIQDALRHQARFEGRVTYDKRNSEAIAVELRDIVRAEQLIMGPDHQDFWKNPSVEELRREQGVEPVADISLLRDEDASPEEVDRFFAALES